MITVTKKFEFCYGHFLPSYDGKCRNMHGHNSVVEVEVGPSYATIEDSTRYNGMIMDFGELKEKAGPIIDDLDHKCLNDHEDFRHFCMSAGDPGDNRRTMRSCVPTAENICAYLVNRLLPLLPGLVRVRVTETPNSWAEWRK